MLKKAGLIVATSVASLVAAGPLAFAGDMGGDTAGGQGDGAGHGNNQNSHGLVNGLNGNNVTMPIQACNNDVQGQVGLVPVQDVAENPTFHGNGALGLLGSARADQNSDTANTRACGGGTGNAGYGNN